eukprot:3940504-Rhodomonas_salina.2
MLPLSMVCEGRNLTAAVARVSGPYCFGIYCPRFHTAAGTDQAPDLVPASNASTLGKWDSLY